MTYIFSVKLEVSWSSVSVVENWRSQKFEKSRAGFSRECGSKVIRENLED